MRRYTIRIDRADHVLDVEELSADTFAVRLADGRRIEVSLTEHRDVAGAAIGPHPRPVRRRTRRRHVPPVPRVSQAPCTPPAPRRWGRHPRPGRVRPRPPAAS